MRNAQYEEIIRREIGAYEYIAGVALELIDEARSLKNQARLVAPILPERVDQYFQMFRRWRDTAPALVAFRWDGMYVLIDGNHRYQAAKKAGLATLDVYVVETTDMVLIDRATRLWNRWTVGASPSGEEALSQAVYLVESGSRTVSAAAAESFVPEPTLRNEIVARQQRTRAQRLGYDPNILGRSVLRMFSAIHNDNVLAAALDVAKTQQISVAQGNRLLELVRLAGSTEAKQLGAIDTWKVEVLPTRRAPETKFDADGNPKPGRDPLRNRRTVFIRGVRNVERDATAPEQTFEKLGISSLEDVRDVCKRVDALYLAVEAMRERFEAKHMVRVRVDSAAPVGAAAG